LSLVFGTPGFGLVYKPINKGVFVFLREVGNNAKPPRSAHLGADLGGFIYVRGLGLKIRYPDTEAFLFVDEATELVE